MSINHSLTSMDFQSHPKIPFSQDYPVPEGYYDELPQRVLTRLEKADNAKGMNSHGRTVILTWTGNARAWAVAASLALVVGAWFLGRLWWSGDEPTIEANSSSALLADLRIEEAHEAVLQAANLEILEEVVEQDPNNHVLLSEWADQLTCEPITLHEALPSLPHDLGILVEETEAEF